MRHRALNRFRSVFTLLGLFAAAAPTASAADLVKAKADLLAAISQAQAQIPKIEAATNDLEADRVRAYQGIWADGQLSKKTAELEAQIAALPKGSAPAGTDERFAAVNSSLTELLKTNQRLASELKAARDERSRLRNLLKERASAYLKLKENAGAYVSNPEAGISAITIAIEPIESAVDSLSAAVRLAEVGQTAQSAALKRVQESAADLAKSLELQKRLADMANELSSFSQQSQVDLQARLTAIIRAFQAASDLQQKFHDAMLDVIKNLRG